MQFRTTLAFWVCLTVLPHGAGSEFGVVSGLVVDAVSGSAVDGALVQLTTSATVSRQLSDPLGRFAFLAVPPNDHVTLVVSKPGFVDGGLGGGTLASGGAFALAAGHWARDLEVRLWQFASISGVVGDERGDAVVGAYVQAMATVSLGGQELFAAGPRTTTDEQGRYRIGGLLPGNYVVLVPPSAPSRLFATSKRPLHVPAPFWTAEGRLGGYGPTFAPSTLDPRSASRISVKPGDQRIGADITLQPRYLHRVTGKAVRAGAGVADVAVRLLPEFGAACSSCYTTTLSDSGGRFVFEDVPEGTYVIESTWATARFSYDPSPLAITTSRQLGVDGAATDLVFTPTVGLGFAYSTTRLPATGRGAWGRMPVVVEQDVLDLVLPLHETNTVRVRVTSEISGTSPSIDPRLLIRLDPAEGSLVLPSLATSERPQSEHDPVEISGIEPRSYFVRGSGSGWTLKSVKVDGRVVTDSPIDFGKVERDSEIDVVVTNRASSIRGSVVDDKGMPVANATVVVFPQEEAQWDRPGLWPSRFVTTNASGAGLFDIGGLPAGSYLIVASQANASALNADFLRTARRSAKSVATSWGGAVVVQLSIRGAK